MACMKTLWNQSIALFSQKGHLETNIHIIHVGYNI